MNPIEHYTLKYSKNYISKSDLHLSIDIILIDQMTSSNDTIIENAIELAIEELQTFISFRFDVPNLLPTFDTILGFQIAPLPPLVTGLVSKNTYIRIKDLTPTNYSTGNGTTSVYNYSYYVVKPSWDKSLDLTTNKTDKTQWVLVDNTVEDFKRDNMLLQLINNITIYNIYNRITAKATPEKIEKMYLNTISNLKNIAAGKASASSWILKDYGDDKIPSTNMSPNKNSVGAVYELNNNGRSLYGIQTRNFF